MSLSATTFAITSVEDERLLGFALVCVDARYASVQWAGMDRLDRVHVMPADWQAIGRESEAGLPPGPIPTDGALYMTLAGERAGYVIVRWISVEPVAPDRPEGAAEALDVDAHRKLTISAR